MIYKNGIKVKKIELVISEDLICHIHLSNDKVWSYKIKKVEPSIIHNQIKLENLTVLTITRSLGLLKKEMEK